MSTGENITLQAIAHQLERIADALEARNRLIEDSLPTLEATLLERRVSLLAQARETPQRIRKAYDEWEQCVFPPADGPGAGPGEQTGRQTFTPSTTDSPSSTGSPAGPVSSSVCGGGAQ